ncbi:hypothetical protein IEQ34_017101 [Dendrobium chrysotoxum]|uniref:Uncharacterized protein n=1 Tax=Dendrobium chrysotoxum TaxID=161865 RepID=A0AAV7GB41_DENCH|nr:hypothetical protein IEQ34_017101 [Dendrobium chrysotoxum]
MPITSTAIKVEPPERHKMSFVKALIDGSHWDDGVTKQNGILSGAVLHQNNQLVIEWLRDDEHQVF